MGPSYSWSVIKPQRCVAAWVSALAVYLCRLPSQGAASLACMDLAGVTSPACLDTDLGIGICVDFIGRQYDREKTENLSLATRKGYIWGSHHPWYQVSI